MFGDERTHLAGCNCDSRDEVLSASRDLLDGVEGPPADELLPLRGFRSFAELFPNDISYAVAADAACIDEEVDEAGSMMGVE